MSGLGECRDAPACRLRTALRAVDSHRDRGWALGRQLHLDAGFREFAELLLDTIGFEG